MSNPVGAAYSTLLLAGTSITIPSYTPYSGSNRVVVAVLSLNPTGRYLPTGVTCTLAGTSMTLLSSAAASTACVVYMFYLKEASLSPGNLVATWLNKCGAVLIAYTIPDVNQTTPFDTPQTTTGRSTSASVIVPSSTGDVVIDALAHISLSSDVFTVGSGQTQIESQHSPPLDGEIRGASSYEAGASSVTMSWTKTGLAYYWAMIGVSVNPSPAGWTNIAKYNGISHTYLSKVVGIAKSGVSKINGVSV